MSTKAITQLLYFVIGVILLLAAYTAGQESQQLPVPEYIEPARYDNFDVFEVSLTRAEAGEFIEIMIFSGNYKDIDIDDFESNRCEIVAERWGE